MQVPKALDRCPRPRIVKDRREVSILVRSTVGRMAKARNPVLNLNGYTDLPPGTVATIVTYLEMRQRPATPPASPPGGFALQPLRDLERYRELFRRVGEPWLWFSRAILPDETLAAILSDPEVEPY